MSFRTALQEGHAELAIKRALFKAAETGDLSKLKPEWLTSDIFNCITFDQNGDSVLACAAQHRHLDKFAHVIDSRNIEKGIAHSESLNLAHIALDCGQFQHIPTTALTGDALAARDHTGNTVLNRAIAAGHIAQIPSEFLVRENLLYENDDSETAFHLAAASGQFHTIPEKLCDPDDCVMLLGYDNHNLILYAHEYDRYHLMPERYRTADVLLRRYPTWDPRVRVLSQVIMGGSLHLVPITPELAKYNREISLAVQAVWDQTDSEIESKASMEQNPEKNARILKCKSYSRTWLAKLTRLALTTPSKIRNYV